VIDMYGVDALRFYVLREVAFGQDGNVSTGGFESRYTSELANEYGNLASRTLAMIGRYRDGVVPEAEVDPALEPDLAGLAERVRDHFDRQDVSGALDEIWQVVRRLNRYVQDEQPWQLSKDEGQAERLDRVLYSLAEGLRVVSVLVHPVIPDSAQKLLAALGREDLSLDSASFGAVPGGATVGELAPLFPRVEQRAA
jgi:methionyl-tRNA synthetase